ncbi:hypothetical protein IE53DRAFT_71914 [Violaceomyces palustris]|uniref:Uncharacterized protein n=1 Tax=Violaceomyces palustris TaxID=1673888 RepID=A0ACD0NYN6_9BASI|nr:hypothetical protein IE53DRAFT_71914 [Violaceomyces palustris]
MRCDVMRWYLVWGKEIMIWLELIIQPIPSHLPLPCFTPPLATFHSLPRKRHVTVRMGGTLVATSSKLDLVSCRVFHFSNLFFPFFFFALFAVSSLPRHLQTSREPPWFASHPSTSFPTFPWRGKKRRGGDRDCGRNDACVCQDWT